MAGDSRERSAGRGAHADDRGEKRGRNDEGSGGAGPPAEADRQPVRRFSARLAKQPAKRAGHFAVLHRHGPDGPLRLPPGTVRRPGDQEVEGSGHGAEILADGEERAVPGDESETSDESETTDVCDGLSPVDFSNSDGVESEDNAEQTPLSGVPADAGGAAEVEEVTVEWALCRLDDLEEHKDAQDEVWDRLAELLGCQDKCEVEPGKGKKSASERQQALLNKRERRKACVLVELLAHLLGESRNFFESPEFSPELTQDQKCWLQGKVLENLLTRAPLRSQDTGLSIQSVRRDLFTVVRAAWLLKVNLVRALEKWKGVWNWRTYQKSCSPSEAGRQLSVWVHAFNDVVTAVKSTNRGRNLHHLGMSESLHQKWKKRTEGHRVLKCASCTQQRLLFGSQVPKDIGWCSRTDHGLLCKECDSKRPKRNGDIPLFCPEAKNQILPQLPSAKGLTMGEIMMCTVLETHCVMRCLKGGSTRKESHLCVFSTELKFAEAIPRKFAQVKAVALTKKRKDGSACKPLAIRVAKVKQFAMDLKFGIPHHGAKYWSEENRWHVNGSYYQWPPQPGYEDVKLDFGELDSLLERGVVAKATDWHEPPLWQLDKSNEEVRGEGDGQQGVQHDADQAGQPGQQEQQDEGQGDEDPHVATAQNADGGNIDWTECLQPPVPFLDAEPHIQAALLKQLGQDCPGPEDQVQAVPIERLRTDGAIVDVFREEYGLSKAFPTLFPGGHGDITRGGILTQRLSAEGFAHFCLCHPDDRFREHAFFRFALDQRRMMDQARSQAGFFVRQWEGKGCRQAGEGGGGPPPPRSPQPAAADGQPAADQSYNSDSQGTGRDEARDPEGSSGGGTGGRDEARGGLRLEDWPGLAKYAGNIKGTVGSFGRHKQNLKAAQDAMVSAGNGPVCHLWTLSVAEFYEKALHEALKDLEVERRVHLQGEAKRREIEQEIASQFATENGVRKVITRNSVEVCLYFKAKTEAMVSVVFPKILGATEYFYKYEFAPGRGAIHVHGVAFCPEHKGDPEGFMYNVDCQKAEDLKRVSDGLTEAGWQFKLPFDSYPDLTAEERKHLLRTPLEDWLNLPNGAKRFHGGLCATVFRHRCGSHCRAHHLKPEDVCKAKYLRPIHEEPIMFHKRFDGPRDDGEFVQHPRGLASLWGCNMDVQTVLSEDLCAIQRYLFDYVIKDDLASGWMKHQYMKTLEKTRNRAGEDGEASAYGQAYSFMLALINRTKITQQMCDFVVLGNALVESSFRWNRANLSGFSVHANSDPQHVLDMTSGRSEGKVIDAFHEEQRRLSEKQPPEEICLYRFMETYKKGPFEGYVVPVISGASGTSLTEVSGCWDEGVRETPPCLR